MKISRLFFYCVSACNIILLNGSNPNNRNAKYPQSAKPKPKYANKRATEKITPKVSGDSEKRVTLPDDTISVFKKAAENNTKRGVRTAGFLLGNTRDDNIEVTHLVIPKQKSERHVAEITYSGWSDAEAFRSKKGYKVIGKIQTYLGNRVELTDMDCHDLSQLQKDFQHAIFVVYTPKIGYGIFRLARTGKRVIESCRQRSLSNHYHKRKSEIISSAKYNFSRRKITIIDTRYDRVNSRTAGKPQIKTDDKPKQDLPGTILIPENMIETFFDIARNHTATYQNPKLETVAYFLGTTLRGQITLTHLMVPQQATTSTSSSAYIQDILNYGERYGLTFTGAIHTHPYGAITPTDGDCLMMVQCQRMFSSFVSMVSRPGEGFKTFRLTDYGIRMTESTPMYGRMLHGGRLYDTPNVMEHVPYRLVKTKIVLVDFRRNS